MVKVVQLYRTDDNHTFSTREEATAHEVKTEALCALKNILAVSMKSGRPEAMLQELLLENQAVSDVLTRFRKRTPKVKTEDCVA